MVAIPAALLNMSATLSPRTGDDDFGNPSYGTAVTLSNIYIEPVKAINQGTLGEQKRGDAILFFDCENSIPLSQTFAGLDKVVWSGIEYNVRRVSPFYDPLTGVLHHWEVELVGN